MKFFSIAAAIGLFAFGGTTSVSADPWKDESGKGRWRGGYERFDRGYDRGRHRAYRYDGGRERRAFKQEWDDGNCKYERKLEKSGEYKEEVKCRDGRRPYPAYGYRYR